MTAPDPIDAAVRRAAEAFRLAAPELDPRSPAGYGPWRAALEAAGLPAALARVAELEAEVRGLREQHPRKALGPHMVRLERTVLERDRLAAWVAELEALLVQAEDYAREAGDERGEADMLLDAAVARADAAEAAVERVRAVAAEFDDEWQQLERDPNRGMDTMGRADGLREASERLDRTLDAAGTPDEVPTTGPQVPTSDRQAAVKAVDDPTGVFDAMVWVRAFGQVVQRNPAIPHDEGTMLAWFANAIMTGYDAGRASADDAAAGTPAQPASPTNDVSPWVGSPCQCGHRRDGHHVRPADLERSMWDRRGTCLDEGCDCERYEKATGTPATPEPPQ